VDHLRVHVRLVDGDEAVAIDMLLLVEEADRVPSSCTSVPVPQRCEPWISWRPPWRPMLDEHAVLSSLAASVKAT
jgi:hypothetical protein